jgi:predicted DNA-binding transcriptional regulator YafY
VRGGLGRTPPELLALFERAFLAGQGLAFRYVDQAGRATQRRVEPHGLLVQPPVWYLLARDVEKGEPRTFRMDRIAGPRLLPDLAFSPDPAVIAANLPAGVDWQPLSG